MSFFAGLLSGAGEAGMEYLRQKPNRDYLDFQKKMISDEAEGAAADRAARQAELGLKYGRQMRGAPTGNPIDQYASPEEPDEEDAGTVPASVAGPSTFRGGDFSSRMSGGAGADTLRGGLTGGASSSPSDLTRQYYSQHGGGGGPEGHRAASREFKARIAGNKQYEHSIEAVDNEIEKLHTEIQESLGRTGATSIKDLPADARAYYQTRLRQLDQIRRQVAGPREELKGQMIMEQIDPGTGQPKPGMGPLQGYFGAGDPIERSMAEQDLEDVYAPPQGRKHGPRVDFSVPGGARRLARPRR